MDLIPNLFLAVSESIKSIEGRLDKEIQLRERVEFLKAKIFSEF
jgi:hypothetical protein